MSFSNAQLVDIRRFCGYAAYAHFGWVFEEEYATLELRLANMAPEEEAVIIGNYLVNLPVLEAAIVSASDNLDTDQAAVWYHNKDEVADRQALYNLKRRELCAFIGVKPGRGLGQGGAIIRT